MAHRTALESGFPSGPYQGRMKLSDRDSDRLWRMSISHADLSHLPPDADPKLVHISRYERCGFDSRDALSAWFDGWTNTLAECGFIVWEYDVPDWAARVGARGQVVFAAAEAVEVAQYEFQPEQLGLFA